MKLHIRYLLLAFLVAGCGAEATSPAEDVNPGEGNLAPLYVAPRSVAVEGAYIVVFETLPVATTSASLASQLSIRPRRTFAGPRSAFLADLTNSELLAVRSDPRVAWVEQDKVYRVENTQVVNGAGQPWGLDRIDQASLPLSGTYTYNRFGWRVHVFVIDTGLNSDHDDFYSATRVRAFRSYDALGGDGDDCHGHGTHVAGIIGGSTYGVAKRVTLHGVRVLNCDGDGLLSDIIDGIGWVYANAQAPAVANLSLGGPLSKTLNLWVDSLAGSGVFTAVAAGNEDDYACDTSPASAIGAFAVGASTSADNRYAFSNWGRCVEVYAPGVAIKSTYIGSTSATAVLTGTSQAAPHVAGLAALLKGWLGDLTSDQIRNRIRNRYSTPDAITDNDGGSERYGTPNLLLFTDGAL